MAKIKGGRWLFIMYLIRGIMEEGDQVVYLSGLADRALLLPPPLETVEACRYVGIQVDPTGWVVNFRWS